MNPSQQGLLNKAQRSLQAAKSLKAEGFIEFAVSRAYYAMFYVGQALLEGEGLSFSRHSGVISALGERFARKNRIPQDYHRYLIDAQAQRPYISCSVGAQCLRPPLDNFFYHHKYGRSLISRAETFLDFVIKNIDSI